VDVSGGWFDAGDYLKFVETASFEEIVLLWTLRDHPAADAAAGGALDAEARFGLSWLERMWAPRSRVLLYQVGIAEGPPGFLGSHDVWALPQASDGLRVRPGDRRWFLKHRPAFRAGPPGAPLSPNLAGRLAAAFGLCAQVYRRSDPALAGRCMARGTAALAAARTARVGRLLTGAPAGFYDEREWRDDMELGAVELYLATRRASYLDQATYWADSYSRSALAGTDSFNLYDVAALAHAEVAGALVHPPASVDARTDRAALLADLRDQLDSAVAVARRDPFGLGVPYADDDTVSHSLGLAIEAGIYDRLAGTRRWDGFARAQRDWALGANAWGASFVIGAGSVFPRCPHHQIANLAGSLDGTGDILLGGTVPGPVEAGELRGLATAPGHRPCPAAGGDAFRPFDGRGVRYADSVMASAANEPSSDLAALGLALAAVELDGRR
jgi:hypothetical protein